MRQCPCCGARYRGDPERCPLDGQMLVLLEDQRVHRSVSGWQVVETLAEGKLATVYRARRGQQLGALKVYRPNAPVVRAAREGAVLLKLQHPNVAGLLDQGTTDVGEVYVVTQFVSSARTLRALMADAELRWRELVAIAVGVADGLSAIHAAGVVHRDLKPENIMVAEGVRFPSVKILDLGHALTLDGARLTQTGLVCGSVPYMSPEQAGGSDLDARSDLYALGVILYEMAVGRRPFEASSAVDLMQMHWAMPPRPPFGSMPQRLEDLCLWLLAKRPNDRPASARIVRELLQAMLAGQAEIDTAATVVASGGAA